MLYIVGYREQYNTIDGFKIVKKKIKSKSNQIKDGVIVDSEWSLAPMDSFRVKFGPGVFRVYKLRINLFSTISK